MAVSPEASGRCVSVAAAGGKQPRPGGKVLVGDAADARARTGSDIEVQGWGRWRRCCKCDPAAAVVLVVVVDDDVVVGAVVVAAAAELT